MGRPRIIKIIKLTEAYKIRSPLTKKEWENYNSFRWDILRKPLKLSHIPLKDNLEDISLHLMGIDNKNNIPTIRKSQLFALFFCTSLIFNLNFFNISLV